MNQSKTVVALWCEELKFFGGAKWVARGWLLGITSKQAPAAGHAFMALVAHRIFLAF